jgi:hypothetical protein
MVITLMPFIFVLIVAYSSKTFVQKKGRLRIWAGFKLQNTNIIDSARSSAEQPYR